MAARADPRKVAAVDPAEKARAGREIAREAAGRTIRTIGIGIVVAPPPRHLRRRHLRPNCLQANRDELSHSPASRRLEARRCSVNRAKPAGMISSVVSFRRQCELMSQAARRGNRILPVLRSVIPNCRAMMSHSAAKLRRDDDIAL